MGKPCIFFDNLMKLDEKNEALNFVETRVSLAFSLKEGWHLVKSQGVSLAFFS